MGDEKIAHDRSVLLTFFSSFFEMGGDLKRCSRANNSNNSFWIVARKTGRRRGRGESYGTSTEIMSANNI